MALQMLGPGLSWCAGALLWRSQHSTQVFKGCEQGVSTVCTMDSVCQFRSSTEALYYHHQRAALPFQVTAQYSPDSST